MSPGTLGGRFHDDDTGREVVYQVKRLPLGMGNLASAGVVAFGRMLRAAGLVAILIVVATSNSDLGLPAAVVYALAFTVELGLSLITYFGGEVGA